MARVKTAASKTRRDPRRAAAVRKFGLHLNHRCLFFGGLAAGFFPCAEVCRARSRGGEEPPADVIKNRPHWMSDFLVQRIAETAGTNGQARWSSIGNC